MGNHGDKSVRIYDIHLLDLNFLLGWIILFNAKPINPKISFAKFSHNLHSVFDRLRNFGHLSAKPFFLAKRLAGLGRCCERVMLAPDVAEG